MPPHLTNAPNIFTPDSEPSYKNSAFSIFPVSTKLPRTSDEHRLGLPSLPFITTSAWNAAPLSRQIARAYVPPAVAPPIALYCSDRSCLERQWRTVDAPLESLALYGIPPHRRDSEEALSAFHSTIPEAPAVGLVSISTDDQLPPSVMQVPDAKRLIYDSAKLARLDTLLHELKAGDHRVLIYSQMTRMLDLMEEFLVFRQHKYLRLDGSSKLEDRRDMVIEWQTRYARSPETTALFLISCYV